MKVMEYAPRLRWIMNGDVQLALEQYGEGPLKLVFAHGWISSRQMWYECLPFLDLRRYTVSLLDFRGCGRSDRPMDGHDLEGYASDLRAVLHAAGESAVLIGHSMGGRLAQYVTASGAAEVAALVLVAPGTAAGTVTVPRQRQLAEYACGSRRRVTSFQRGAMRVEISREAAERLTEDALFAQREHWFGWYDRGRVGDFTDLLANIAVPVEVLAAADDPLVTPGRVQREVIERISGSRLKLVEECGHNIPLEKPAAVVEAVERVLARLHQVF